MDVFRSSRDWIFLVDFGDIDSRNCQNEIRSAIPPRCRGWGGRSESAQGTCEESVQVSMSVARIHPITDCSILMIAGFGTNESGAEFGEGSIPGVWVSIKWNLYLT